jgi:O-antigen/teichoic acid export membrane protein
MIRHAAIPVYFGIRIISALILLKLSAQYLTVESFANFTQFLFFASLLNTLVLGGAQNGLIRQAAAAPESGLNDVQGAGLAIWAAAVPLIGIPVGIWRSEISHVLTGSWSFGSLVLAITLLSLCAGPGQISWGLLSGRKLTGRSLGAQATGLLAGTAASAWFIIQGTFGAAAIAFAAGPVIGAICALPFVAQFRLKWRPKTKGLMPLLAYSGATSLTLGFTSLVLFSLRSFYRERFGGEQLSYWLAANRISDMSTQFLGLMMLQAFVPHMTGIQDPAARSRLVVKYAAVGAGLTGGTFVVFAIAGKSLVHIFLSDAYLPAIPAIRLYMAGDFLRVAGSLAMFSAFAAGKPGRYAGIETATMAVMAAICVSLIESGEARAPQIAYAAGWGLTALVLGCGWALRSRKRPRRRLRPHAGHQKPLEGIVPQLH